MALNPYQQQLSTLLPRWAKFLEIDSGGDQERAALELFRQVEVVVLATFLGGARDFGKNPALVASALVEEFAKLATIALSATLTTKETPNA